MSFYSAKNKGTGLSLFAVQIKFLPLYICIRSYCSYCSNWDVPKPYPCPFCKQKCARRWNLSVHIQRKHPGQFNPILELKRLGLIEPHSCKLHRPTNNAAGFYNSAHTNNGAGFYNSNLPKNGFSFLSNMTRNPIRFQNILREASQLDNYEINLLLIAINDLPNF